MPFLQTSPFKSETQHTTATVVKTTLIK